MRKGKPHNKSLSYLILELEIKTKHGYFGRNGKITLIVTTPRKSRSLNDTSISYPKWVYTKEGTYS